MKHEIEAYFWLGILILMPIVAYIWHKWLTPIILPLDNPAHDTSLRDNGAGLPDAESNSRCNSFTK